MSHLFVDSGMPKGVPVILVQRIWNHLCRSNYDRKLMAGTFSICKTKKWREQEAKSIEMEGRIYHIS